MIKLAATVQMKETEFSTIDVQVIVEKDTAEEASRILTEVVKMLSGETLDGGS